MAPLKKRVPAKSKGRSGGGARTTLPYSSRTQIQPSTDVEDDIMPDSTDLSGESDNSGERPVGRTTLRRNAIRFDTPNQDKWLPRPTNVDEYGRAKHNLNDPHNLQQADDAQAGDSMMIAPHQHSQVTGSRTRPGLNGVPIYIQLRPGGTKRTAMMSNEDYEEMEIDVQSQTSVAPAIGAHFNQQIPYPNQLPSASHLALPSIANGNLSLSERPFESVDLTTLRPSLLAQHLLQERHVNDAKARHAAGAQATGSMTVGFLELPKEVRAKIYRCCFVTPGVISFIQRASFQRSAALLSTCKKVHEEGVKVLYSENAFHFERSKMTRGDFFESKWAEIGFQDIMRFLTKIGTHNISLMRYLCLELSDGKMPATGIKQMTEEEVARRFVNDPVLYTILKNLLGPHALLRKLTIRLVGRREMKPVQDQLFIEALTCVKTEEVEFYGIWRGTALTAQNDIRRKMVVARVGPDHIAPVEAKHPRYGLYLSRRPAPPIGNQHYAGQYIDTLGEVIGSKSPFEDATRHIRTHLYR